MSHLLGFCGLALLCALCVGCDERRALPSELERLHPRLEFAEQVWVVLFSLDSLAIDGYTVQWADDGIGNFYIRPGDLARLDFSKVMYYWDSG